MLIYEMDSFNQNPNYVRQIIIHKMNQYTVISKLGQGAFSVVYRVKRKQDGKEYAMKKMRLSSLSEKQVANCLNEVRILASIDHPNILAYKDSFFDQLTNTFCIVTECLEGGDIFQLISRHKCKNRSVDEGTIWKVAYQCLKGLATLHDINVLHRDIKSANIFLNKEQNLVKLADMNVSIVTANGMAKTQTGTPYYASPQVWMEKPYSAKCDIWSLGCVLYEIASLRPPFVSHDLKSLKRTIIAGIYKRIPSLYSNELQNFIRLCLKVDPKERLGAHQLLENDSIKYRNLNGKQLDNDSQTFNSSQQLLEKIHLPSRKDFKNIRIRLPKNRFQEKSEKQSVDKIQNQSFCLGQKNKENMLNFMNTNKNTRKNELPTLKRSSSLNAKEDKKIKIKDDKIVCQQRPPLPNKKPIRA